MSAEHFESVALRELIDEQRSAMRLDVTGTETFEFVVVVLDAFREVFNNPASHLNLCFTVEYAEKCITSS